MKSTFDPTRAASASGCNSAVGSGDRSASTRPGACANDSAAVGERLRASRTLSDRDWRTSATAAAATSSTTCWLNTWAATLRRGPQREA